MRTHGAEGERGLRKLLSARASGEEHVDGRHCGAVAGKASGEDEVVEEVREGMVWHGGEQGREELGRAARGEGVEEESKGERLRRRGEEGGEKVVGHPRRGEEEVGEAEGVELG
jgi:hypothetical protein